MLTTYLLTALIIGQANGNYKKPDEGSTEDKEIQTKMKKEFVKYQCWKLGNGCKSDGPLCALDKMTRAGWKTVRMFDDECSIYKTNCEKKTFGEQFCNSTFDLNQLENPFHSLNAGQRSKKNNYGNGKTLKRRYEPKPKIQIVNGIPIRYFI